MNQQRLRLLVLAALGSAVCAPAAIGQCPSYWDGAWGNTGTIYDSVLFDDGSGEALYVGGQFSNINFGTGTTVQAKSIAKRTATGWQPLPENLGTGQGLQPGWVRTMAVFQGEMYAAGLFHQVYTGPGNPNPNPSITFGNIARFNGQHWNYVGSSAGLISNRFPIGAGPRGFCMHVHDDGDGEKLYVGGDFDSAGGVWSPSLARWDGIAWSTINVANQPGEYVNAIATFDEDGAGPNPPRLFVGGTFSSFNGVPAKGLARWDGTNWSAVAGFPFLSAQNPTVEALCVYDPDGDSGPLPAKLYVGGQFSTDPTGGLNGPEHIAAWDGTAWSTPIPHNQTGGGSYVTEMTVGQEGSERILYIGTQIWSFQGYAGVVEAMPSSIMRFDGVNTTTLGGGVWIEDPFIADPEYEWPPIMSDIHHMSPITTERGPGLIVTVNSVDGGNVNGRGLLRWMPRAAAADFNLSGQVTVQDIFDFLAAWFAGLPTADFNGMTGVTVQDIFDFLAAWFSGGC